MAKGLAAYAVNPAVVTVIGLYVAPAGTSTDNVVEVADNTCAFTAPKKTILSAAVLLKLFPESVTVEPTRPDTGEKETIEGWAKPIDREKSSTSASKFAFINVWVDSFGSRLFRA